MVQPFTLMAGPKPGQMESQVHADRHDLDNFAKDTRNFDLFKGISVPVARPALNLPIDHEIDNGTLQQDPLRIAAANPWRLQRISPDKDLPPIGLSLSCKPGSKRNCLISQPCVFNSARTENGLVLASVTIGFSAGMASACLG